MPAESASPAPHAPPAPSAAGRSLRARLTERFYDILASVYLYNEHRGYTGLERLLGALRTKYPDEDEFLTAVTRHLDDERRHYRMFRRYFERQHRRPFAIGPTFGYVDQFVQLAFRRSIDTLDEPALLDDDNAFRKLCRLIMMTEFRGMRQVAALLASRRIQANDDLQRIFRVIERDEPAHCFPYQRWLAQQGNYRPTLGERLIDQWVHWSLVYVKLPLLFMNPWLGRLEEFPDGGAAGREGRREGGIGNGE